MGAAFAFVGCGFRWLKSPAPEQDGEQPSAIKGLSLPLDRLSPRAIVRDRSVDLLHYEDSADKQAQSLSLCDLIRSWVHIHIVVTCVTTGYGQSIWPILSVRDTRSEIVQSCSPNLLTYKSVTAGFNPMVDNSGYVTMLRLFQNATWIIVEVQRKDRQMIPCIPGGHNHS
eukprot:6324592-Pyramimonas_sp.AAC.1